MARWLQVLHGYDFDIGPRPGTQPGNVTVPLQCQKLVAMVKSWIPGHEPGMWSQRLFIYWEWEWVHLLGDPASWWWSWPRWRQEEDPELAPAIEALRLGERPPKSHELLPHLLWAKDALRLKDGVLFREWPAGLDKKKLIHIIKETDVIAKPGETFMMVYHRPSCLWYYCTLVHNNNNVIATYVLGEGLAGCTGSVDHVILGMLLFIQ